MQKVILVAALTLLLQGAQAQVAGVARPQPSYLGLGVTGLSGYYTGPNESATGLAFAPTMIGSLRLSPVLALRGSVAYQRERMDRDESSSTQRFVRHQTTRNVVVPLLLQATLNPATPRFHAALAGGLTFWHVKREGEQTYYYTYPNQPEMVVSQNLDVKRLDTFVTGGLHLSYQFTRHVVALAEGTISGRIGGEKTKYYEYLPSTGILIGAGYNLRTGKN
jgi:hypothetical protein